MSVLNEDRKRYELHKAFTEIIGYTLYETQNEVKGVSVDHPDEWIGEYVREIQPSKDPPIPNPFKSKVDITVTTLMLAVSKIIE